MWKDLANYSIFSLPFSDSLCSITECHVAVIDSPGFRTCSLHRQDREVDNFRWVISCGLVNIA